MGSLFKHRSVRWVDTEGHRVAKGTPGSRKKKEISKYWWAKYRDAGGVIRRVCLGLKDKQSAWTKLAELEKKEDRRKVGLEDRHTEHAARPLADHIKDWFQALKDGGASQRRRDDLSRRINKLVALASWTRLVDITEASAVAALAKLEVGIQTRNDYIQHIKQFARWCVPDRLLFNPLAKLKGGNVNTDRRHDRRELSADEQARLLKTTEASTVIRYELDGSSRAMLYDVAFATGFRRGELRSLTRESFDLDAGIVTVAAAYSKHRQQDMQPLPAGLVERLRHWFAEERLLWPGLTQHTAKMFRADLEAAGIPYVVPGPDGLLYADFHSTRHSFISAICRTNSTVKELMDTARHSDPRLTFKRYAKIRMHEKAKVVAQLPDPRASDDKPQAKMA